MMTQPTWKTSKGFWYVSLLDWRFTADPGIKKNPISNDLLPGHIVEVMLWRCEPSANTLALEAQLSWRAGRGGDDGEVVGEIASSTKTSWITRTDRRKHMQMIYALSREAVASPTFGFGSVRLEPIAEAVPIAYRMKPEEDFGAVLNGLGLPDLAWPLPAGGVSMSEAATSSLAPVHWRGGTDEAPILIYDQTPFVRAFPDLTQIQETIAGFPISMSLDATANGSLGGHMAWDGAHGRPAWSTLQASLQIGLGSNPVDPTVAGGGQVMRGRLDLRRHAWQLPGADDLALTNTKALLGVLLSTPVRINGKGQTWDDLVTDNDPVLGTVAAGVVHACVSDLRIESVPDLPRTNEGF